ASTNQSFGLPVTVAAGEAVKDVEIKFRPAGAITGRVLNEDGEPMANVTVQAMRYAYIGGKRRLNPEGQAQTNDLGEYRIFNLLPKKYYVRASVSNGEGFSLPTKRQSNKPAQAYWPVFYPDAKIAATATRLEVKPSDEQHANFNLVPVDAYVVSGKVMGIPPSSGGQPGYGMAMLISKEWREPVGTAMLSPKDPSFEIGPVPPGSYQLVAFSAEITGTGTMSQGLQNFKTGHELVNVAGANVSNVVVNLGSQNTVEVPGKIHVNPAPPAAVDLSRFYVTFESADENSDMESAFADVGAMASRSELGSGRTSKEGSFKAKFSGSSGIMQPHLGATGGFEDYYTKSILLGGRDVTESGISPANLTPGATLELIVSPYGGRIDGVVLDSNKKPVVGAFVACVPEPKLRSRRELFITDTTNQQGHYVLRGLRPGSYKVYAFDEIDPGAIYSSEFLKPFEDMGESLTIQERDTVTKNLLVLHQTED
ncbi:MAG: carboxypeptidase-like regulatory domain-containing protein, partial [Terriglobales bacterium]